MKTERAEAGTRVGMTDEDERRYSGVSRHPLARRWMLQRLIEAKDSAQAADTKAGEQRWAAEADRIAGELRRCGVGLGSD